MIWPGRETASTTTSGQNGTLFAGELIQHGSFPLAKAVLPFHIEDPGNIGTAAFFNNAVRIEKTVPEFLG